jgi:hypothetical protein
MNTTKGRILPVLAKNHHCLSARATMGWVLAFDEFGFGTSR